VTRARRDRMRSLLAALLIFAAPVVWLVFQQGVGLASYLDCRSARPPWGGLVGVGATLACAAAAWRCWLRRKEGTEARRFLTVVGAGASAIFALAALTTTVALLVVPACAR